MAWVAFVAAFDWSPPERRGRVTIAYKAGQIANVTTPCAAAARAAGVAVASRNPDRPAKPDGEHVGG